MEQHINYIRENVSYDEYALLEPLECHYFKLGTNSTGFRVLIDQWVGIEKCFDIPHLTNIISGFHNDPHPEKSWAGGECRIHAMERFQELFDVTILLRADSGVGEI